MSKIEKLTSEQEQLVAIRHNEWLKIGLCTDPADRPRAEVAISKMYNYIKENKPTFMWFDSPMTANLGMHILKEWNVKFGSLKTSLGDSLRTSLRTSLWDPLGDSLGDSLRDSLWDSLRDSLRDSLGDPLRDSLRTSLRTSLRDSLWDSLRDSLRDSLGDSKIEYKHTYFWGQQDSSWIAFYEFCQEIGVSYKPESQKQLSWHSEVAKSCMWFWPFKGLCIISERPKSISMKGKQLHCDGGPAVLFRDGWSIHALNGVRVPSWLAETTDTAIDPKRILEIENAEVRREFVRKVGIDRVCHALDAQCIDEKGNYRLLMLDLQDGRKRPFLQMLNPSIHIYHVEGVHPDCKTVAEALQWRNGTTMTPEILT